jgi:hypothetical protein
MIKRKVQFFEWRKYKFFYDQKEITCYSPRYSTMTREPTSSPSLGHAACTQVVCSECRPACSTRQMRSSWHWGPAGKEATAYVFNYVLPC